MALTAERRRRTEQWKYKAFTLASGTKAYKGGLAAMNSSGKVVPASSVPNQLVIGTFFETVDATAGDATVTVDLGEEITVERFANASSTDALLSSDIGTICYAKDDATVGKLSAGRSVAGRVWDVSSTKGVAVQKLETPAAMGGSPSGTMPAQVSNDFVLTAAGVVQGAIYELPATAANSTVTLPTAAPDGTKIYLVADGTNNGHTVQYRDASGSTNITTALTASKRHLVVAVKASGKWFANAYVSP